MTASSSSSFPRLAPAEDPAAPPPAAKHGPRRVSIVVPTFREADSLPHLLERLNAFRDDTGYVLEVLLMDDASGDGSAELVAKCGLDWVHFIERTEKFGLSQAVVEGLRKATLDYVVCMDADLSHPPEAIPAMIDKLNEGHDFVIGSRYVPGGTTDDDWGFGRWLNSRVATVLARPLTNLRDPMAGFFAFPRAYLARAKDLNPVGYKIALELLVKGGCTRPGEVPIHFSDRQFGESKLTFKQQLLYIQHLRRLYLYRYGTWTHMVQFFVVGGIGAVVNLTALTILLAVGIGFFIASPIAIALSMVGNFLLNRRFTFSYARKGSWWRQFVGFMSACSIGAAINYAAAAGMKVSFPEMMPQLAACVGIVAGMGFNFLASRFLVFRAKHVVKPKPVGAV